MRIVTVISKKNKKIFILQCHSKEEVEALKNAVQNIKEVYKDSDEVIKPFVHTLEKIFARFDNKYERQKENVAFSACIFEEEMVKFASRSLIFLCMQANDIENRRLEGIINEKEERHSLLREKACDSEIDYNAKRDDATESEELEDEKKKRMNGKK